MLHRRAILIVALIWPLSCGLWAGDVHVTFRVVVPSTLAPLTHAYIASSVNGWSASSPVWKMTPAGSNHFTLELDLPDSQRVEYYYTLGVEPCAETQENGRRRENRVIVARAGLVQYDTVARWKMESVNIGNWLANDVLFFQKRWIYQRLGMSYPESRFPDNPVRKVGSIPELDSLLKSVQSEWRVISMTQYEGVLPDLFSGLYVGIMALVDDRTLARQARDYLLEYYQLPAFFGEYADLQKAPSISKVFLLSTSPITLQFGIDTYWLAANDTISVQETPALASSGIRRNEQRRQLSAAFATVPALVDQYLSDPGLSDQSVRASLSSLKLILEQWKPSWQIMDDLVMQRRDQALAAFRRLRCDGSEGIGFDAYQRIAGTLFEECVRSRETDKALDVSDSLFAAALRSFPSDTSMKMMYKTLYTRADSARGPTRYTRALARSPKTNASLPSSPGAPDAALTGRYLDITSRDTVNLADLRGKIVVIDFWTTWCGACITGLPETKKHAVEFSGSEDVAFISVLCDLAVGPSRGESYLSRFVAGLDISFPVLLEREDRSLLKRFQINWYPSMAVVNGQGQMELAPKDATSWRKIKERIAVLRTSK